MKEEKRKILNKSFLWGLMKDTFFQKARTAAVWYARLYGQAEFGPARSMTAIGRQAIEFFGGAFS